MRAAIPDKNRTPRTPLKTFTPEQIMAALDVLKIPYKREGSQQINADTNGTGHYHLKISPRRGLYLDAVTGNGGRISGFLFLLAKSSHCTPEIIKILDWKTGGPGTGGKYNASNSTVINEDKERKKRIARAQAIWTNGWACQSIDAVYQGIDLDKAENVNHRGLLRERWTAIRNAAFAYFDTRKLDHRWMPQLRLFLLTSEKDDYAMNKNGAVGGIAMPRYNNKQIVGLQRIFLDKNGKKITRMMLGGAGSMLLKPLDTDAQPLPLSTNERPVLLWGEGWETCAHAVQSSNLPCDVLYTAGDVQKRAALYLEQSRNATPDQIAALPIMGLLVDRDVSNTGQNACVRAIRMLRKAGIAGLWLLPPDIVRGGEKSTDWADIAEELGHEAAGKALMLSAYNQPEIPEEVAKTSDNSQVDPENSTSDLSGCPDPVDFDYSDYDEWQIDEEAILIIGQKKRKQNYRKLKNADGYADLDKMPTIHDTDQGRKVLKTGIEQLVDAYVQWLSDWQSAKQNTNPFEAPKIPEYRPFLVKPTCGTGKSTALKNLPNHQKIIQAGGAVRIFVATKDEAEVFVKANPAFFQYHGRSPVPSSPGFCANYEQMIIAVENGHIPQAEFCFHCKHGLKWSVDKHGKTSKQGKKSLDKLAAMGITGKELEMLDTCVWQDHQREALKHQAVVTTHHSYSDNLSTWHRDGKTINEETGESSAIPALSCFDEDVPFSETIEKITHQKVDEWAQRNAKNIRFFRHQLTNDAIAAHERMELNDGLEIAEASQESLVILAQEFAKMTGKNGRISEDSPIWNAIENLINIDFNSDKMLAAWEKLDFDKSGDLTSSPLRGAYAIAQTLRHGDGHIENGALHVSGAKPLIERLGKYPTALFNATPSPADEAIIKAKNGIIIDVTVKQHVKINRRTNRFYGLKGLKIGAKATKRVRREVLRYERIISYFPNRKFIIHQVAQELVDPEGTDFRLGHWGADHRAQNRFEGDPLVLAGSFHIPQQAVRHAYQAQRLAALMAGASSDDWPLMQDFTPVFDKNGQERDDAFEHDCWVYEGNGVEVRSFMPLPRQPKIREWYLKMATIETVQGIGRARAVNASEDEPIDIDIFGGVPLFGLARYGLAVDGYLDDPDEAGQTHEEWVKSEQERTSQDLTKAAVQTVADGETITRNGLNERVKKNRVIEASEAAKKQQETEAGGLYHLGNSIYTNVEQTPKPVQEKETGVRPDTYKRWLEKIGMPIFADVMAVNGRAAAAVRAAQYAMRDYRIDCDKLFKSLELWAETIRDDGITADDAAESDRYSKDTNKRDAAAVYRELIQQEQEPEQAQEQPQNAPEQSEKAPELLDIDIDASAEDRDIYAELEYLNGMGITSILSESVSPMRD